MSRPFLNFFQKDFFNLYCTLTSLRTRQGFVASFISHLGCVALIVSQLRRFVKREFFFLRTFYSVYFVTFLGVPCGGTSLLTMIVYHRLYQKSTEISHEFRRNTSKHFPEKNLAPLTLTVKDARYIYQLMSINATARPIAPIGSFSKMSSSILIMVSGAI